MTGRPILWEVIHGRARSLVGWGISVAALIAFTTALFPSIQGQDALTGILEDYPDFLQQILGLAEGFDITTPEGYLNSQVFTNMLPLLGLIFLIGLATRSTAIEERAGTMDIVLAQPVGRRTLVAEKLSALVLLGTGLIVVSLLVMLAVLAIAGIEITIGDVIAAHVMTLLLSLVFGCLAFTIALATGRRAVSIGVSAGLAVAAFLIWGLAPLVSGIRPLRVFSPFYWALRGPPIARGFDVTSVIVLVVAIVVVAAAAFPLFERRDVGV